MIKRLPAIVVFAGMIVNAVPTARTAVLGRASPLLRSPQPRPDILLVTIDALTSGSPDVGTATSA